MHIIHAYMHVHGYMHVYIHGYVYIHEYMHMCIYMNICKYMDMCIYMDMSIDNGYMHTHRYMHIHRFPHQPRDQNPSLHPLRPLLSLPLLHSALFASPCTTSLTYLTLCAHPCPYPHTVSGCTGVVYGAAGSAVSHGAWATAAAVCWRAHAADATDATAGPSLQPVLRPVLRYIYNICMCTSIYIYTYICIYIFIYIYV